MKNILHYLSLILDEAYKEQKGKLFIAPLVVAGIISGAITIGKKIAEDIKAKKAAKKVDEQAAIAKAEATKVANKTEVVARGVARQGDPTVNDKIRKIDESAANTVGKVTATSGSTQEIINAAQGVQKNKDSATNVALTQSGQFDINAKKMLSERVVSAGQLKLGYNSQIDAQTQAAVAAIGANAQAGVDSAQAIGSQGIQIASMMGGNNNTTAWQPKTRAQLNVG